MDVTHALESVGQIKERIEGAEMAIMYAKQEIGDAERRLEILRAFVAEVEGK